MDPSGYDGAPFIPEFYDHVVPYASHQDVAFYVDAARHSGGPVLELGCGTGRVLIPTRAPASRSWGSTRPKGCSRPAAVASEPSRPMCSGGPVSSEAEAPYHLSVPGGAQLESVRRA